MPSVTQDWTAHEVEMGKKKRLSRSTTEPESGDGGIMTYEPIMDTLEVDSHPSGDDELPINDQNRGNSNLETPVGMDAQPEQRRSGKRRSDGDATSLYPRSHFTGELRDRHSAPICDDGATVNSTRSIAPHDVEYVWEYGRRYCGTYYMPNDEQEQSRLFLVHEVYKSAFNDEPFSAPLEDPRMILDVGAGTGEWAIDVADRYPDCEVTGIDIADVFPRFVAPNLFWEIDNAELEWLRPPNSYDLVHFRNMSGAFRDWPFVYEQAFKVCKPGGWIEVLDDDDRWMPGNYFSRIPGFADSKTAKIALDWKDAHTESGYQIGVGHMEPHFLRDAGFVDVKLVTKKIPIGPKEMSTGKLFLKSLLDSIEAQALRLLCKYKGYTPESVHEAADEFREVLKNMALDPEMSQGFNVQIKVLTGRKPDELEQQCKASGDDAMDTDTRRSTPEKNI